MIDYRDDTKVAYLFGFGLLVLAAVGFTPNPLIGEDGLFLTNASNNLLTAGAGLVLLSGGLIRRGKESLLVLGVIYVLMGILGYWVMDDTEIGPFAANMADHYLHLLMGIVLITAGSVVSPYQPPAPVVKAKAKRTRKKTVKVM